MGEESMSGGEADGVRLLALARRELLETLLPQLDGDARYRARLIANAMKIAAGELEPGATPADETMQRLCAFVETALAGAAAPQGEDPQAVLRAIGAALRAGELDGDSKLYDLLGEVTARRRERLG
jgi:hypothetical protein